jgi:hypothetical protein
LHSQLVFNECIARALKDDHVHNTPYVQKTKFEVLSSFEGVLRIVESYLPASNTEKEAQHIRLLLLLKLFNVF